jgi:hypothetical protein
VIGKKSGFSLIIVYLLAGVFGLIMICVGFGSFLGPIGALISLVFGLLMIAELDYSTQ